jgi:hypothetical protein
MTTMTTSSSSAQKRVSLEGGDEQKNHTGIADAQGDEQSRKRCKKEEGELEKKLAISPDSAKNETANGDPPQAETDDDDDASSATSGSTTNDPSDDDEEEDTNTPRTDKEEILYIVSKRLWSDDFVVTAAALALFCKLTMTGHDNRDEHLKTAFIRGAPVLIARVMSMNRTYHEIQKHGCLALSRLANVKIDNAQHVLVDIGGLKLCRRAANRYKYCPIVQASVCCLIGSLFKCPHVREHAITEGLPTLLHIMNSNKKEESVQLEGCLALYRLVKQQNPQLVGSKEAVNGGAIECIISAMERFPKSASIQTRGCGFFYCIYKDYRERIIEAKGLIVIAEAGRIHKDNKTVFTAAQNANQVLFMM